MMGKTAPVGEKICFVDMPFGRKTDPHGGAEIDFDQIYQQAIQPAIADAGLCSIRGDREETGGIIHQAMFARLLLSEFVIADLTTANANVFYELGVRHAARPYTTIPIFATTGEIPFDVNMVRAVPYELKKGKLTKKRAAKLRADIEARIRRALEGPVAKDSPLFQLFERFPGIEISHELTDLFMDQIQVAREFEDALRVAMQSEPKDRALERVKALQASLGDLKSRANDILMKLFLTYRDLGAWDEMVELYEEFPGSLKEAVMARQQLALALNRRAAAGDRDRAIRTVRTLIAERGQSAETFGILGRIHKDRYKEAITADDPRAPAMLDEAIDAYTRGFECEPADYYPGVNAITLLIQKGTKAAQKEAERLTPLVSFAVARRGGAASDDYWDLATVLELAMIGRDGEAAQAVLAKVLNAAKAAWMANTTADNLSLLLDLRKAQEDTTLLAQTVQALRKRAAELPQK
jgi:hypothetical protein